MGANTLRTRHQSNMAMFTQRIIWVILVGLAVVFLNLLASSKCNDAMAKIVALDSEIKKREAELEIAAVRWQAIKRDDNVARVLRQSGCAMRIARPNQIVRLDGNGRLQPGQNSVALARRRLAESATASYAPERYRR